MLGDWPVIVWTIRAVQGCFYKGDYVVSSDEQGIINIARRHNVDVILRPSELALDETPTIPALQHAVRTMEGAENKHYKYIIEVRATSPFKTSQDIDAMVGMLMEGADSVIGMTALDDHHPMRAKWLDEYGMIRDFIREPSSGRRQDCLPRAYIRNGTVYALTREAVMEQGKLFGHKHSIGYVMPAERSINLDTEMDWMLCQAMVKK
jgi:CMP-N,N'-diacetyllegionaminic acid synthase